MATSNVKGRVQAAAYRVDAGAVAEAMLRHPGIWRLLGAGPLRPDAGARIPAPALRPRRGA